MTRERLEKAQIEFKILHRLISGFTPESKRCKCEVRIEEFFFKQNKQLLINFPNTLYCADISYLTVSKIVDN